MVRKIQINLRLSNKTQYTIATIVILILLGVIVYAYSGSVGHSSDQIDEVDPTVINSVKNGVSWDEVSGIPAGFLDGVDDEGSGGGAIDVYSCPVYADTCYGRTRVMPGGCNGQLRIVATCVHGHCGGSTASCTYVGTLGA